MEAGRRDRAFTIDKVQNLKILPIPFGVHLELNFHSHLDKRALWTLSLPLSLSLTAKKSIAIFCLNFLSFALANAAGLSLSENRLSHQLRVRYLHTHIIIHWLYNYRRIYLFHLQCIIRAICNLIRHIKMMPNHNYLSYKSYAIYFIDYQEKINFCSREWNFSDGINGGVRQQNSHLRYGKKNIIRRQQLNILWMPLWWRLMRVHWCVQSRIQQM